MSGLLCPEAVSFLVTFLSTFVSNLSQRTQNISVAKKGKKSRKSQWHSHGKSQSGSLVPDQAGDLGASVSISIQQDKIRKSNFLSEKKSYKWP